MTIQFDPNNNIIQLCMMAMGMAEGGRHEEAERTLQQAWNEAANGFERFIAAYHLARHQSSTHEELKWLEKSLQHALELDDVAVKSAYPTLYTCIADCYERLHDPEKAKMNHELSDSFRTAPSDEGPFYHGTRADLQVGDKLTAGGASNYKPELKMNHIYFTALINGAGLAAALANGDGPERIYIVEPTGAFENDPNVTDKKFPGNLTRSYRSQDPLTIVGEETEWVKLSADQLRQWREKLAKNTGKIIN